jgi:drug/metabolite transporter (DMT)-like permease
MAGPPIGDRRHSPVRGVLWMTAAALCFSAAIGFVRHLSDTYTTFEIAFFRQVLGIVVTSFWVWRVGLGALKTRVIHFHFVRAILGYSGLVAGYYVVRLISLADAQALQFTLPFFTFVFAGWALKETIRAHRWMATVIGFAGALIIIRPGFADMNVGMLIALVAAALFAGSDVTNRFLSGRDAIGAIIFYGYLIQLPVGFAASIPGWVTPSLAELPLIIVFAASAVAAQWCLTLSFAAAEASLVSPVLYLRLPFAALIGFVFFGQVTDTWTWIGAAIMFASTFYSTRIDARIATAAAKGRQANKAGPK